MVISFESGLVRCGKDFAEVDLCKETVLSFVLLSVCACRDLSLEAAMLVGDECFCSEKDMWLVCVYVKDNPKEQ